MYRLMLLVIVLPADLTNALPIQSLIKLIDRCTGRAHLLDRLALPVLIIPDTVRILQIQTLAARLETVLVAGVQGQCNDLARSDHDQCRVALRDGQLTDLGTGWERLRFTDHHRPHIVRCVRRQDVNELDHLTIVGTDEDHIVPETIQG
uniref:Putative secreted protein n=1 Tax=Anopheles darlingi TaxID=43151 RepID=A0A2M4DLJ4_ANODA